MDRIQFPTKPPAGAVAGTYDAGTVVISEHVYSRGAQLEKHCHSSAFLSFVLAGSYSQEVAGRTDICHPRTVLFLPAGEPHANRYHHGARCLHIELDERRLEEIEKRELVLKPGRVDTMTMPAIFTRLLSEFRRPDDLSILAIRALTTELLIECCRGGRSEPRDPSWMKTVEEVLRGRFTERITVEEIARLAGVHVVHVCRQFRKIHGCTIGEFIRRLRVEKACALLSSTDASLAQLALIVGCSDQSHLSSMFKLRMGITPNQYRRFFRSL